MKTDKKMRGSALLSEGGTFVFTPFASLPEKEKKMRMITETRYASLWIAKNKVSIRMVFDRKWVPPFQVWVEEMAMLYKSLIEFEEE